MLNFFEPGSKTLLIGEEKNTIFLNGNFFSSNPLFEGCTFGCRCFFGSYKKKYFCKAAYFMSSSTTEVGKAEI